MQKNENISCIANLRNELIMVNAVKQLRLLKAKAFMTAKALGKSGRDGSKKTLKQSSRLTYMELKGSLVRLAPLME